MHGTGAFRSDTVDQGSIMKRHNCSSVLQDAGDGRQVR